jgi:hypothetical protein
MSHSAAGSFDEKLSQEAEDTSRHRPWRSCRGHAKAPWSFWEIALMVAGFVVFWPVGLVILFWKLKKGELWQGSSTGVAPWSKWQGRDWSGRDLSSWRPRGGFGPSTGNSAFEDYKTRELERLERERQRLFEEQKAFGEFMERLKRARDQEEFDRFMSERRQGPAA